MIKRSSLIWLAILLLSAFTSLSCSESGAKAKSGETVKFYVGSYDGKPEYSIFLCEVDPISGAFSLIDSSIIPICFIVLLKAF